jgi:hypothetical protein
MELGWMKGRLANQYRRPPLQMAAFFGVREPADFV